MFGVWYPPPFFHAAGADELILLLVGVDLALGPLLTLIVFRANKRGLMFDLVVIGMFQTAALVYGMSIVLQSRPVFLVAAVDRLVVVGANDVSDADLVQGSEPRFRSRSWTGPRLVAARMPTDPIERSNLAFSALAGRDLQNLPRYYCDYADGGKALLQRAKPLEQLLKKNAGNGPVIEGWLRGAGRSANSVVWIPLQANKADMVMLLDAQSAEPLKALRIDPW